MTTPVKITFHNMSPKPRVEREIHDRMTWLETVHPGLTGGRVVIDVPHRHKRHGREVQVNIALTLPGGEVVVNHQAGEAPALDDGVMISAAIHEAFDAARRQLEDLRERQRGE